MSVKTFVITLPKPLPPGAQVKGVVTPQMLSKVTTAGKPTTMDFSGNLVHFIKEEPTQVIEVSESESEKPVRKRQKLDHLTYEEKIMRRKLKNRVAAQTARDRKKVRMEELELQVSEMAKEMTEITNLVEMLTEQNQQLEQKNTLLGERLSQCTCNTISTPKSASKRSANVVSERKTPVCGVTEQSAEGSHTAGSNLGLISNHNVLSVGNASDGCIVSIAGSRGKSARIVKSTPTRSLRVSIKRNCSEVDATSSTTMATTINRSSFNDHDYSDLSMTECKGTTLTADEEKMLIEITKTLQETLPQKPLTDSLSNNDHVPTTPELLDLLQFDEEIQSDERKVKVDMQPLKTPPSPITKEEILDFLQDSDNCLDSCKNGSESGYDSAHSPLSLASDDFVFEQECNSNELFQLFPSLIEF